MSRSPRAEALHILRTGQEIAPPTMPDNIVPDSAEAAQHLDDIKEARYVVLASLIGQLLDSACSDRQPDERHLVMRPYHKGNRWQALADDWRDEIESAISPLESTNLYKTADNFAFVKGVLQPGTHISVRDQLQAGIGTGISSTLSLLRNLPHIVRHNTPPHESVEPFAVARHPRSLELVRRLSKLSVNGSMGAQTALAGEGQAISWADIDKVLDPELFVLHRYDDNEHSLGYRDFAGLRVPAGYRPRPPFPPATGSMLVSEIPSFQAKVIGCPVTLLEKRLGQLWHWGIDLVEANDMCQEQWPPMAARTMAPELSRQS